MPYSNILLNKYIKKAQKHFATLNRATAEKMNQFFQAALTRYGILLLVHSSSRNLQQQWELRKKWLLGTGGKAARPGSSWHNFKRAIDVVPLSFSGTALWNSPDWEKVGGLAKEFGLKWGKSFGDKPHIYDASGTSLSLLRSATPGLEKYAQMEAELLAPVVKKEAPNIYVEDDNKQVRISILKWGLLSLVVGVGTWQGIKYVREKRNISK